MDFFWKPKILHKPDIFFLNRKLENTFQKNHFLWKIKKKLNKIYKRNSQESYIKKSLVRFEIKFENMMKILQIY